MIKTKETTPPRTAYSCLEQNPLQLTFLKCLFLLCSHFIGKRENELIFAIFTLTTLALLANRAPSSLTKQHGTAVNNKVWL